MGKKYTENSIESLSPLAFTRLKPGVYAGDTTYATQLLVEIVSNSIDEYRGGHGDTIEVTMGKNNVYTVRDNGQGFITNLKREDGTTVLEAAFSVINTSGKYREDGAYEGTSLGSFGIGAKLSNFLSHWLTVSTCRDGKVETVTFKEGEFSARTLGFNPWFPNGDQSGTVVQWQPSEEFFTHAEVEKDKVIELFRTLACLCPALTLKLTLDDGKELIFCSKNGLQDYIDDKLGDKEILKNRCKLQYKSGKNEIDFILTYTSQYTSTIVPYVNTGLTEKGPHITQVKSIVTKEFNKFFREKKWLKEKEENLSGDDIQEGMYVIFNITVPNVSYDAQVKSNVVKIDMTPFTAAITEAIQKWCLTNEKEVKIIAEKALSARRAREAAKKARDAARTANPKDKKKTMLNMPTKLVDCWGKDRTKCEILIVEGDSAAGGLIEGRNSEIHAIFPVRGKIIASYKHPAEKVLANQEISNLIKALGLEFDPNSKKLVYNEKSLRYGKILLAADAK